MKSPDASGPPGPGASARPTLLHEFLERAASRWPSAVAVDIPPGPGRPARRIVSYAELDRQANAVAHQIRACATGECVVAVLAGRGSEALYVAQIGALKAGAAHACVDLAAPDGQLLEILADSKAAVLLVDREGARRARGLSLGATPIVDVTDLIDRAPAAVDAVVPPPWLSARSLAYLIYTSGTTGRPKGVMIEHGAIANLVESDLEEFRLRPGDRVGQGSSPAYDSSIEEVWLALAAGATVVVMDHDVARLGPDLAAWIRRERLSVWCPPPTALRSAACSDPASALPDLRLLYVGGEALPQDVADRWAVGRRLVNGYGPTEVTVTCVRGDVSPGAPVSIGSPISGVSAWVLDDAGREVADGEPGELCLGGVALARGYWGQPALTARRFPFHPTLGRIYRTGDAAYRAPDGRLYYHGRIDAQVKLRGYRVELEAVEARLSACDNVREAACTVQGAEGHQWLVGFVVPAEASKPFDGDALRAALSRVLPAYMVPGRIVSIAELPTTLSGKLDRKRLPIVEAGGRCDGLARREPRDTIERSIAEALHSVLERREPVSIDHDFFDDLGGDSLRAALLVSRLREHPDTAALNVRDVYECRTAEALARRAVGAAAVAGEFRMARADAGRPSAALSACLQAVWLLVELAVGSAAAYVTVFHALPGLVRSLGLVPFILLLPVAVAALLAAYVPVAVGLTVAAKTLLIGRYAPRRERVWSGFHVRAWIVQSVARLVPWRLLAGTELHIAALRALGARIGRRVHIHRGVNLGHGGWDLLEIGDDVSIAQDASLRLVDLDDGHIVVGAISIGDRATLDMRSGVGPGTRLEAEAYLAPLSSLPAGVTVPRGERWDGVPARPAGPAPPAPSVSPSERPLGPWEHAVALGLAKLGLILVRALPFQAVALAAVWHFGLDAATAWDAVFSPRWPWTVGLIAGLLVSCAVPLMVVLEALVSRALGRVDPGVVPRASRTHVRVWLKTGIVESAGRWLSGTMFWPLWLRAAGMRVGRGCEVSTIIDVVPELVEIGDESFFADGIYLGSPAVHRGTVRLAGLRLGRNTFIGNHAVVPCGQELPEDVLFGVCTVADERLARPGTSWFGQPAFELPRREVAACDRRLTHDPSWIRMVNRAFWEALRFALPVVPVLLALAWCRAVKAAEGWPLHWLLLAAVPLLVMAAGAALCVLVLALKWVLLGRVRPGTHPLWSCWCSRWDFLYVAWNMYARGPLGLLEGTAWLTWYLRAMGMRLGRRVVLGGGFAQVVDPDMIVIEDDATVSAAFQAHTFEDRVLKIDRVHVRRRATLAGGVVPLYGADIGEHAYVAPHSVIMKRERLLPGASYEGVPTRLQAEAATT